MDPLNLTFSMSMGGNESMVLGDTYRDEGLSINISKLRFFGEDVPVSFFSSPLLLITILFLLIIFFPHISSLSSFTILFFFLFYLHFFLPSFIIFLSF